MNKLTLGAVITTGIGIILAVIGGILALDFGLYALETTNEPALLIYGIVKILLPGLCVITMFLGKKSSKWYIVQLVFSVAVLVLSIMTLDLALGLIGSIAMAVGSILGICAQNKK